MRGERAKGNLIISILLFGIVFSTTVKDYCEISKENVVCQTACALSNSCGIKGGGGGDGHHSRRRQLKSLKEGDRQYIVDLHNVMRNELASGTDNSKFPPAANMHTLSYDRECEFLAECMLKQCEYRNDYPAVASRRDKLQVQLLGASNFSMKLLSCVDQMFYSALTSWYEKRFSVQESSLKASIVQINDHRSSLRRDLANFVQLIWADTEYVGCAYYQWRSYNGNEIVDIMCVYRPRGDLDKKTIYEIGPVASKCDEINERWKNLCGHERDLQSDPFELINSYSVNVEHNFFTVIACYALVILFQIN